MFVVKFQQARDVQALRTVADAVVAGCAGQGDLLRHLSGDGEQRFHLRAGEGLVLLKGGDVGLELFHIGHARERDGHCGQALQKAERPGGDALLRAQGLEARLVFRRKMGELAAAQRLHHPHGDVVLPEQFDLGLRVLKVPVQIVDLQLAELHVLSIGVEEALQHRVGAVGGKAQMADAARGFLLHQIVVDAVLGVEVGVDVHLADVVEEVEVKILDAALFQLFFKNGFHHVHVGKVVAGKLGGEEELLAGMARKRLAHHQFGISAVIAPGGVEVVDAVRKGIVHHGKRRRLVDLRVVSIRHGQAHAAKAEGGELHILKIPVDHGNTSLFAASKAQYTRGNL